MPTAPRIRRAASQLRLKFGRRDRRRGGGVLRRSRSSRESSALGAGHRDSRFETWGLRGSGGSVMDSNHTAKAGRAQAGSADGPHRRPCADAPRTRSFPGRASLPSSPPMSLPRFSSSRPPRFVPLLLSARFVAGTAGAAAIRTTRFSRLDVSLSTCPGGWATRAPGRATGQPARPRPARCRLAALPRRTAAQFTTTSNRIVARAISAPSRRFRLVRRHRPPAADLRLRIFADEARPSVVDNIPVLRR